MRSLVIVVLVALVAVGGVLAWRAQNKQTPAPAEKQTLYMMVPQGLFVPVSKVMDEFQEQHPKVEFQLTIDTPEAMAQMVEENEKRPDIFISPGGHEIQVLNEKGYIDPATMVAFGSYGLAILVPQANPGKISKVEDLLNPEVKTISISDPDLNAACFAARQALQNMGLWDKLESKMEVTGCCMSSFRWILDGRAEANIQFLGCPIDPKTNEMSDQAKVKIACTFPKETFYVPRNVAGLLKGSKQRELAQQFVEHLTSPETIEFMAKNRLRNDAELPLTRGPWGSEQEANPLEGAAGAK
jgi:molybdate transport system substrate-binding protein